MFSSFDRISSESVGGVTLTRKALLAIASKAENRYELEDFMAILGITHERAKYTYYGQAAGTTKSSTVEAGTTDTDIT